MHRAVHCIMTLTRQRNVFVWTDRQVGEKACRYIQIWRINTDYIVHPKNAVIDIYCQQTLKPLPSQASRNPWVHPSSPTTSHPRRQDPHPYHSQASAVRVVPSSRPSHHSLPRAQRHSVRRASRRSPVWGLTGRRTGRSMPRARIGTGSLCRRGGWVEAVAGIGSVGGGW